MIDVHKGLKRSPLLVMNLTQTLNHPLSSTSAPLLLTQINPSQHAQHHQLQGPGRIGPSSYRRVSKGRQQTHHQSGREAEGPCLCFRSRAASRHERESDERDQSGRASLCYFRGWRNKRWSGMKVRELIPLSTCASSTFRMVESC